MNGSSSRRTGILRAEMTYGETHEVACAIELDDYSVFVITYTLPPVDTVVGLKLSFPQVVEPIELSACVVQVRFGSGPGTPSGFVAGFGSATEEQRARIRNVVQRLAESSQPARQAGRGVDVLLVEDNRLVRDMFAYAVAKYFAPRAGSVRLDQASDTASAWDKLTTSRYDLVIVDFFLPQEDGATLITRLRQDPRLANTSVVAISIGGSDVRRASLSAGADLFLHKPLVLRDLFQTLEFLSQQGAADAGVA